MPPGVSPSQEGEQNDQDKDEEDVVPDAVRVIPGMDSAGGGDEEDGFHIKPVEDSIRLFKLL
jgi:hypothetical protein